MTHFAGNAHWTETSTKFASSLGWRARPSPLNCKIRVPSVRTEEGKCSLGNSGLYRLGVSQARKPMIWEMSDRSNALHSASPQHTVISYINPCTTENGKWRSCLMPKCRDLVVMLRRYEPAPKFARDLGSLNTQLQSMNAELVNSDT